MSVEAGDYGVVYIEKGKLCHDLRDQGPAQYVDGR